MLDGGYTDRKRPTEFPVDYSKSEEDLLQNLMVFHANKGRCKWGYILSDYNSQCTVQRTKQGLMTKWKRLRRVHNSSMNPSCCEETSTHSSSLSTAVIDQCLSEHHSFENPDFTGAEPRKPQSEVSQSDCLVGI